MKKIVLVGIVLVTLVGAGYTIFRIVSAQDSEAAVLSGVSIQAAQALQQKIDNIKEAHAQGQSAPEPIDVAVNETELESYVLFSLREKIPIQLDSINVQLTPGAVASDTQLTFKNSTGNPLIDAVVGGTHNLFVRGKLTGIEGRGRFELEEIRVDGIPVPRILIETLFEKYVKPSYPDADLKEPFDLPWGIRAIDIQTGAARIRY